MTSAVRRLRANPAVDIAFRALTRNRLQTALTMIGIAVGVGTVLAMMAVGAGAQRSIEQQVRAAGLNQITVTAGNWKPKTEDVGAAVAHQGDARDTLELPVPELMLEPEAGVAPLQVAARDSASSASPASSFGFAPPRGAGGDVLPARFGGQPAGDVVHAIGSMTAADEIALVRHPEDDPMEKHDH